MIQTAFFKLSKRLSWILNASCFTGIFTGFFFWSLNFQNNTNIVTQCSSVIIFGFIFSYSFVFSGTLGHAPNLLPFGLKNLFQVVKKFSIKTEIMSGGGGGETAIGVSIIRLAGIRF